MNLQDDRAEKEQGKKRTMKANFVYYLIVDYEAPTEQSSFTKKHWILAFLLLWPVFGS